jgi:hypothetical protein
MSPGRDVVGPGLPAAFPVDVDAREDVTVEAAIVGGHQKEALVHAGGQVWRLASDEGAYLKGTDLAPAPLMYWAAGLHAEFVQRLAGILVEENSGLRRLAAEITHGYAISGSFFDGTAKGDAFAPEILVDLDCDATADAIADNARLAIDRSPVFAALRSPRLNTFALHANGRRRAVTGVPPAASEDAVDPFLAHGTSPMPARIPQPQVIDRQANLIPPGAPRVAVAMPAATRGMRFASRAVGSFDLASGLSRCTVTFPDMPSSSFSFRADAAGMHAPSGTSYAWAGVAFCYLTQLSRYIETRKLAISGARLVQHGSPQGPVKTHLYLNGSADDATMQALLAMGAHTCYLHATLGATLEPVLRPGSIDPQE